MNAQGVTAQYGDRLERLLAACKSGQMRARLASVPEFDAGAFTRLGDDIIEVRQVTEVRRGGFPPEMRVVLELSDRAWEAIRELLADDPGDVPRRWLDVT